MLSNIFCGLMEWDGLMFPGSMDGWRPLISNISQFHNCLTCFAFIIRLTVIVQALLLSFETV